MTAVLGMLVLAGAALGYAQIIVFNATDTQLLDGLVVTSEPAGFKTHASTREAVPSTDIFPTLAKQEVASTPRRAGQFAADWKGKKSTKVAAALTLTLLTSDATAQEVLGKVRSEYMDTTSITGAGYTVLDRFTVGSVDNSHGVTVTTATKKTQTTAVVFRSGRAVVLVDIQSPTSSERSAATRLARNEASLLRTRLAAFSMERTVVPAVASIVYWVCVVAAALVAVTGPLTLRRIRRGHRERHRRKLEEARRRERLSRGRKVVRRKASFR